jgi:predicted nucleotide-binding protein with TIR-like domain
MRVFLGSSREAVDRGTTGEIAVWIERLDHEPVPWDKPGLFLPGIYLFSRLVEISKEVDAALFLFAEDDQVWYRGDFTKQPRDNVLIEYGLFAGALGMNRAILCREGTARTPSDLAGITYIDVTDNRRSEAQLQLRAWLKSLEVQKNIVGPDKAESVGPLRNRRFSDDTVNNVIRKLEKRHRAQGSDLLPPRELLESLNVLFNRKTFRHESLLQCTLQNWTARLHAAYQTLEVLRAYQDTVLDIGSRDQSRLYQQLLKVVDRYCMIMATYLFEEPVDESKVKKYIGTPEFNSHLSKERKFREARGVLQEMDPSWDESRQEAVKVMDELMLTLNA